MQEPHSFRVIVSSFPRQSYRVIQFSSMGQCSGSPQGLHIGDHTNFRFFRDWSRPVGNPVFSADDREVIT